MGKILLDISLCDFIYRWLLQCLLQNELKLLARLRQLLGYATGDYCYYGRAKNQPNFRCHHPEELLAELKSTITMAASSKGHSWAVAAIELVVVIGRLQKVGCPNAFPPARKLLLDRLFYHRSYGRRNNILPCLILHFNTCIVVYLFPVTFDSYLGYCQLFAWFIWMLYYVMDLLTQHTNFQQQNQRNPVRHIHVLLKR